MAPPGNRASVPGGQTPTRGETTGAVAGRQVTGRGAQPLLEWVADSLVG